MKKKDAISLIIFYLPSTIHAVLLKDKKGKYSIATGNECVEYQIKYNFKKIKRLYAFLGLPGKVCVTKF